MGVTWAWDGVQGDSNNPHIFFLPKNNFGATELKGRKLKKIDVFSKRLFGW
jgi:hypothetical protein